MSRHLPALEEHVKLAIDKAIQSFLDGPNPKLEFPSSLSNEEGKYIHNVAPRFGFHTKSHGHGAHRSLTAYKNSTATVLKDRELELTRLSCQQLAQFLKKNPLSVNEQKDIQVEPSSEEVSKVSKVLHTRTGNDGSFGGSMTCTTGRLCNGLAQVPPQLVIRNQQMEDLSSFRQSLPIYNERGKILQFIDENQVLLISGDTGCGKTTQVPQFILDEAAIRGTPCRVLVAEPRRIAAVSVAERVAHERGETVGQTVGYQIRLESRVSPRTLLTYCTNGVLLRTLMGGENSLNSVTHVVLDEVHERDRFSDLSLAVLKDHLTRNRQIRLIIMSATFDTDRFVTYFGGPSQCPVVQVEGNCHDITHFFLEDILEATRFKADVIEGYKKSSSVTSAKIQKLQQLSDIASSGNFSASSGNFSASSGNFSASTLASSDPSSSSYQDVSFHVAVRIKELMKEIWRSGSEKLLEDLLSLYINESVDANFADSETGLTALIISAARGKMNFVEEFLRIGANVHLRTPANDWNAIDWAINSNFDEISDLLKLHLEESKEDREKEADEVISAPSLSEDQKLLLEAYHRTFDDEEVDLDLILVLLRHIYEHGNDRPKGSVLVFLPGYDEIVTLRQMIIHDTDHFDSNKYVLYTLHSQMQSSDQKKVFKRPPNDVRKIILSTNIAETSVTIDDVVYVIDSGKVKEKSYQPLIGVTCMKSVWISQSNALQRRGRAGRCRPGVAYLLYSSFRYKNMPRFRVPEILRVPVHEICLHVKLLAPSLPLLDFLQTLPDPPSAMAVKHSIEKLRAIDAFDSMERLTELGFHLLDLPLEPQWGKMVLYSVVLKCLDPILTIVCTLAHRDPFLIPLEARGKVAANQAKKKLGSNALSDHIVLLKAFQGWQAAKNSGSERLFCSQYFINPSAMEMIHGIRTQLLGQLRASGFVRARGQGDIRDLNANSDNWPVVKAALSAGCYPNLVRIDRERGQLTSKNERKIRFHPSSLLSFDPTSGNRGNPRKMLQGFPTDWFVYEEMAKIGTVSGAKVCTIIHPVSLAVFAGPSRLLESTHEFTGNSSEGLLERDSSDDEITGGGTDSFTLKSDTLTLKSDTSDTLTLKSDTSDTSTLKSDTFTLKIDEWISFRVQSPTSSLIAQIRQKWHSLFLRKMANPSKPSTASDEDLVRVLCEVLMVEDQTIGLEQPAGVGQRPVPMNTEYCPPYSSAVINSPIARISKSFRGGQRGQQIKERGQQIKERGQQNKERGQQNKERGQQKNSPRSSSGNPNSAGDSFLTAGINAGHASFPHHSGHGSNPGYYRYF